MTKKLLVLFFTCLWVLPTWAMQEPITQEHATVVLMNESRTFLEFSRITNNDAQYTKEYEERLVQHMTRYPDSQDVWSDAIVDLLRAGLNRTPLEMWQIPLAAVKSALGTDAAQEIASELVPIIYNTATSLHNVILRESQQIISFDHIFLEYLPYLTVLFHYGAQFTVESVCTFPALAILFEECALQVAGTTLFRQKDHKVIAYHLLKKALMKAFRGPTDATVFTPSLSKEDIKFNYKFMDLPTDNLVTFLRNRELHGSRFLTFKYDYASLVRSAPQWPGRIFHIAYASLMLRHQRHYEYMIHQAKQVGCILQEILFLAQQFSLSYYELRRSLLQSNVHAIRDNNPDVTADQIFTILLQDDPRALQYYTVNKETILNSVHIGNSYSLPGIINSAEEIRINCNSLFSHLKDLASCNIQ